MAIGLVSSIYWFKSTPEALGGANQLLFPLFLILQLLPLPLFVVRLISPNRARILDSLAPLLPKVSWASLSIDPAITVTYLCRACAFLLVFILIKEVTKRMGGHSRWLAAIPIAMAAAAEAAFGLLQSARTETVEGTYVNKNHFAGLMEMALPLAVAYAVALFSRRAYAKATVMLGVSLLIFSGSLLSLSKMGFVAALAGLFVMAGLTLAGRIHGGKKWLAVAGLAALLLFGFVFLPSEAFIENYGGVTAKGQAAFEGRGPIARETLSLIGAYPAVGVGFGNYETGFLKYQAQVVDRVFTYAHNDYLQSAAELGLAGLALAAILLLPVVGRAFRAAVRGQGRTARYLGAGCAGAIAAMALHSLADFNMYVLANALAMAWICGIAASLPVGNEAENGRHGGLYRKIALAMGLLLAIYAPVRMVFDSQFRSNPRAEDSFCRFDICDTDAVVTGEKLLHGGQTSKVPAAVLLKALRRDPNAPIRWCDAGDALLFQGHATEARYCYARALALGQHIPPVLMQAADFYRATHEWPRAAQQMAQVLKDTDAFDDFIFEWYAKYAATGKSLVEEMQPDQRAAGAYLRYLLAVDDPAMGRTWNWIAARGLAGAQLARDYVAYLYEKKQYGPAAEAWAVYLGPQRNGYLKSDWIYNGGFERGITGSAFDWQINDRENVEAAIDTKTAHSGSRSLRIQFNGKENLDYGNVAVVAFVKPGRYRFEAYLRTEGITTDKGIGLHLYDAESGARLDVRTEYLTGTHDWTKVERLVTVPAATRLIRIEVNREHSMKFDNLVAGTVWIDDVRLLTPTQ